MSEPSSGRHAKNRASAERVQGFSAVGLNRISQPVPARFSGGQRQRIASRGARRAARLMVLDEPSPRSTCHPGQIVNLLGVLKDFNLLSLHRARLASSGTSRPRRGDVPGSWLGDRRNTLYEYPLHHTPRRCLAVAVPTPWWRESGSASPPRRRRAGESPSGCRFHPRCPWAATTLRERPPWSCTTVTSPPDITGTARQERARPR